MKVTEQLEWDYDSKRVDDGEFMTEKKIKNIVAAELFIPIVKTLYDKNIFTSWSGLTGDAHIRIPLDGLSKENYRIAQENCINNPDNWRMHKPTYRNQKDILPNYFFEIKIDYEDGVTEVSELVNKMLNEVQKFQYQDIQIAKAKYARYSKLPRVDLDGLYEISGKWMDDFIKLSSSEVEKLGLKQMDLNDDESEYFYVEELDTYFKNVIKFVKMETFEELSESFLEGDSPEYYYDEKTNTFFKNRELIRKSREYEAFCEISEKFEEKMSDQQKYKIIYDWVVNNFNYAYSGLYLSYAENLVREESEKGLQKFFRRYGIKKSQTGILNLEHRKNFLNAIPNLSEIPEEEKEYTRRIIELLEKSEMSKEKEGLGVGETWISRYGVCQNFADIYESLCKRFGLPCRYIEGTIDSGEFNVGHAWNAIMVNGKVRYVDISSAIHCKDGSNKENNVEDFFNKSFEELLKIDNGKNRKINEYSVKEIKNMIDEAPGWNFGD